MRSKTPNNNKNIHMDLIFYFRKLSGHLRVIYESWIYFLLFFLRYICVGYGRHAVLSSSFLFSFHITLIEKVAAFGLSYRSLEQNSPFEHAQRHCTGSAWRIQGCISHACFIGIVWCNLSSFWQFVSVVVKISPDLGLRLGVPQGFALRTSKGWMHTKYFDQTIQWHSIKYNYNAVDA